MGAAVGTWQVWRVYLHTPTCACSKFLACSILQRRVGMETKGVIWVKALYHVQWTDGCVLCGSMLHISHPDKPSHPCHIQTNMQLNAADSMNA